MNSGRWDACHARSVVDAAGIGLDERIVRLSPGRRARVVLALALGRRPELLLDEPLAELDPLARAEAQVAQGMAHIPVGTFRT